jgi:RNA polymerase sigma factor (sigma-70 family)
LALSQHFLAPLDDENSMHHTYHFFIIFSNPKTNRMNSFSDKIVLIRFKNGDEKAFNKLYEEYHFLAYSIALEITHSSEDSKEIVNDVFAWAWASQGNIDENKSFRNYICRSAKNAAIDSVRKREYATLDDPNEVPASNLPLSADISYQELEAVISQILDGENLFIFLSHVEGGLTFKEIGRTLGISGDAASSAFTRIRARLSQDPKIAAFLTK